MMLKRALIFFLLAVAPVVVQAEEINKSVAPDLIIDVRTNEEYAAGHIDGAVNIPHEQIAKGILMVKGVNKDSAILLYCKSGRRASLAEQVLKREGFRNVVNGGSIDDLKQPQPDS